MRRLQPVTFVEGCNRPAQPLRRKRCDWTGELDRGGAIDIGYVCYWWHLYVTHSLFRASFVTFSLRNGILHVYSKWNSVEDCRWEAWKKKISQDKWWSKVHAQTVASVLFYFSNSPVDGGTIYLLVVQQHLSRAPNTKKLQPPSTSAWSQNTRMLKAANSMLFYSNWIYVCV